jgi:hypothetical protein
MTTPIVVQPAVEKEIAWMESFLKIDEVFPDLKKTEAPDDVSAFDDYVPYASAFAYVNYCRLPKRHEHDAFRSPTYIGHLQKRMT